MTPEAEELLLSMAGKISSPDLSGFAARLEELTLLGYINRTVFDTGTVYRITETGLQLAETIHDINDQPSE